jgi:predicted nucleic acid-binding protein
MPEGAVVADSTVLIFLGKLRRLDWLRAAYEPVLIPTEVYEEVVVNGKELGARDAILVENAIDDGWIEVHEIDPRAAIQEYDLEAGETEVFSLALAREHDEVLVDEESVRDVARLHDLRPRGTLSFLFTAVRDCEITFDEFLELLETLLEAGFYLDEAVYLESIRKARQLAAE